MDKKKEEIDAAKNILCSNCPKLQGIYLFGTYGTCYERKDSDLDLAFLQEEKSDPVHVWKVAQEIARSIHKDVDLIDLRSASTVLRFQIISEGSRIHTVEEERCDAFELMALSRYYHFNEARKELLKDF